MIKRADSQYLNMPKLANMTMTAVFLYILALIMPITGFLLPAYKIRSINTMKKNGWLILNITIPLAILVVIGILDTLMGIQFTKIKALGVYFMVFFPIELLYYFFVKIKFFVNIFDRIIITGILILLVFLPCYLPPLSIFITFIFINSKHCSPPIANKIFGKRNPTITERI